MVKNIKMSVDKKILQEIQRIKNINRYILNEQEPPAEPPADPAVPPGGEEGPIGDVPPPADAGAPAPGGDAGAPPTGGTEVPEPVDVANDPDVEEVGAETEGAEGGEEESEEIDITDLVTTQQEIKDKQDGFMDDMISKLDELQSKLQSMDQILSKIENLEKKFDRYRDKTPEEKLELRSLDSYPYNQKLTDFFDDKKVDMEKSGKNEYILTSDEVENFSPGEIKKTFNIYDDEEEEEM
jgi:hypothetical protein